jgi:predicted RNase H-like HicB family nuclease
MFITVNIPFKAICHAVEGGGYWAEVKELPGCMAQAEALEELEGNLVQAVTDWLQVHPEKTEEEARQLAKIQGTEFVPGESYPVPNEYLPPPGWTEDDE